MEMIRITNDVNGNPRYVIHFLDILSKREKKNLSLDEMYKVAIKKANQLGGKKYHTKNFGGGLVFQSYNTGNLKDRIIESSKSNYKK